MLLYDNAGTAVTINKYNSIILKLSKQLNKILCTHYVTAFVGCCPIIVGCNANLYGKEEWMVDYSKSFWSTISMFR